MLLWFSALKLQTTHLLCCISHFLIFCFNDVQFPRQAQIQTTKNLLKNIFEQFSIHSGMYQNTIKGNVMLFHCLLLVRLSISLWLFPAFSQVNSFSTLRCLIAFLAINHCKVNSQHIFQHYLEFNSVYTAMNQSQGNRGLYLFKSKHLKNYMFSNRQSSFQTQKILFDSNNFLFKVSIL